MGLNLVLMLSGCKAGLWETVLPFRASASLKENEENSSNHITDGPGEEMGLAHKDKLAIEAIQCVSSIALAAGNLHTLRSVNRQRYSNTVPASSDTFWVSTQV